MSIITYQYRVKDSTSHKRLEHMASAVNFVWNYCNEVSLLAWRRDKKWLSAFELNKLVSGVSEELDISAATIQQICREYATRRHQFKKVGLAWRSKKRSLGWIPFRGDRIRVKNDTVRYFGHCFRFWASRPLIGTIKAGSFNQDARRRWYVNFQCEVPDAEKPQGKETVGIDLGLKTQVACSNGIIYRRNNITQHYAQKLAQAQRARKFRRVRVIHSKIARTRKDWAHKTTTAIAQRACLIVVGNISSKKLKKTCFAKAVSDASWHHLRACLRYKAIRLGVPYYEVNEFWSSVTCADCGQRTGPRGLRALGVREWNCTVCGVSHDRDVNAARNILFSVSGVRRCTGIP